MPDPDVLISEATIPDDGIVHVGSKATLLEDGNWQYDYVVHNQNAERIIAYVNHSIGFLGDAYDFEFHDVSYHDDLDNLIENEGWNIDLRYCNSIANWYLESVFEYPTSNAIRWGTAYSFSFRTAVEPFYRQDYGLTLFALPPEGDSVYLCLDAYYPPPGEFCPLGCNLADLAEPYDTLNFFDVSTFLGAYGAQASEADLAAPFGTFNFFDVSAFLGLYGEGCP